MSLFEPLFSRTDSVRSKLKAPKDGAHADDRALARYRYMLQTASPETIEQAHADAFARLTTEQRRRVLAELARTAPAGSDASHPPSPDDTRALARLATRAELRQPGFVERTLSRAGLGAGSGLLASFVAGFAGSLVAQSFFSAIGAFGADAEGALGDDAALAQEEPAVASDELGFGDEGTYDFGSDDFGMDI